MLFAAVKHKYESTAWLKYFFSLVGVILALVLLVATPYSFLWIYESGDLGADRAVAKQSSGTFALFGSEIANSNDADLYYKVRLCEQRKPDIVLLGSSRMLALREGVLMKSFVNMGGTANSLTSLRYAVDELLQKHKPELIILGVDYWWFTENWQKVDKMVKKKKVFSYTIQALEKPWQWLVAGKLSIRHFFAPLTGEFRAERFGLAAQFSNDGYGPDGSRYAVSLVSGRRTADAGFVRSLQEIRFAIDKFAPSQTLDQRAIDSFSDTYFHIRSSGIQVFVVMPPLAMPVFVAMASAKERYVHLFDLQEALTKRGIDVLDLSDTRISGMPDCEFLDGVTPGEIGCDRVLREMTNHWHELLTYINMEKLSRTLNEWTGHVMVRDERVADVFEEDFLHLGCLKKTR